MVPFQNEDCARPVYPDLQQQKHNPKKPTEFCQKNRKVFQAVIFQTLDLLCPD